MLIKPRTFGEPFFKLCFYSLHIYKGLSAAEHFCYLGKQPFRSASDATPDCLGENRQILFEIRYQDEKEKKERNVFLQFHHLR